jgi:uncharacterized protein YifE (UPF0438 family)
MNIETKEQIRPINYANLLPLNNEENQLLEEPVEYSSLSEKKKHLAFLKFNFQISCSREIFSPKEIDILVTNGAWLEALHLHKIKPLTELQETFIEQIEQGIQPENKIAKVWFKYIKRIEIEKKFGTSLKVQYQLNNNDFYSREDYYKLHEIKR